MLSCRQVTEQASAYIDGELGFVDALGYRLHLGLCSNCRRFVHNFRAGIEMMRRLPEQKVDPQRIQAVFQNIQKLHSSK